MSASEQPRLTNMIFLGMMRSLCGFPFEHPLELIKTTAQANPHFTLSQVIRSIVQERGLFGFSNTILASLPRRVLREAFRWPMLGYTHDVLVTRYPKVFTREGTSSKVVTGICVALFECIVIHPLDQLIIYRVSQKVAYGEFFRTRFSKSGVTSLYQGVSVNLLRQGLMWTTFMAIYQESNKRLEGRCHPYVHQGLTSIFIGLGVVSWGLPLDFIKTRIQMDVSLQQKRLTEVVKDLYRQFGFRGFYSAAGPVFLHSILHATISSIGLKAIFSEQD